MISYKQLWKKLEEKGISKHRLKSEYSIGYTTIQRMKENQSISLRVLDKFCQILHCKLEEIAEYIPDD